MKATRLAITPSRILISATSRAATCGWNSISPSGCLPAGSGFEPILFRPPYSIDQEPDTADQVRPLEVTQDMGYVTIGNRIDPNDWRENPHRSAEQITAAVMKDLPPCSANDQLCGNIILLHDGGGDRRETVRALPMIIDGFVPAVMKLSRCTSCSAKPKPTSCRRFPATSAGRLG